MNKKRLMGICMIFLIIAFVFIQPAYGGPGGQIAKIIANTFWGKMLLSLLSFILLPVGIYIYLKQKLAERRAYRDLRSMAQYNPNFEWLWAKQRIMDCFHQVHCAWEDEDLSGACEYITDWYWQNRQLAHLDRWHREGLRNIREVKKVLTVRPLLFIHRNDDAAHEGSLLVVSITANTKDYLVYRKTGNVVEGDRKFKDHETIWSFKLTDGQWRVSNIEEIGCEFSYIYQAKSMTGVKDAARGHVNPTADDTQFDTGCPVTGTTDMV